MASNIILDLTEHGSDCAVVVLLQLADQAHDSCGATISSQLTEELLRLQSKVVVGRC